MIELALSVSAVVVVAAVVVSFRRFTAVVLHKIERFEGLESANAKILEDRLARLEESPSVGLESSFTELEIRMADQVADLTLAVSEGIAHVDRSERRVRAVVQSAKARMERAGYIDPGLEAEDQALLELDVADGREERLPPVSEGLAGGWAGVPGMKRVDS